MSEPLTDIGKRVDQDYDDSTTYYQPWYDLIDLEYDFSMKLLHYVNDTGETKDRRRIQPRGLQLYQILRHKTARVAGSEIYLEMRPIDGDSEEDPDLAHYAKFALEQVLFDRMRGYRKARKRMVTGAFAARSWITKVEYDPEIDEILFSNTDPTRFHVPPGCLDIHDARTPYVIEERTVPLSAVEAMKDYGWEDTEKVHADGTTKHAGVGTGDAAGNVALTAGGGDSSGPDNRELVTLLFAWYRKDPLGRTVEQPMSQTDLPAEDQKMRCPSCGYEEQAQPDENGDVPIVGEDCPACGVDVMVRVDTEEKIGFYRMYGKGVLIIKPKDQEVILYDKGWPQPLRSFPFLEFIAYEAPRDHHGQSDSSLNWSLQVVSNSMLRLGYDQMRFNVDLIMTPAEGLVDRNGEAFDFSDEVGRVAYFADPMAANATKHFQGSGLPPSWAVYFNAIEGVYASNRGTSDFGLPPDRSRDIAVGTVRQLTETGEIPTDQHIRDLRDEESIFFGIVWDMIRATWTEHRWVRLLGQQGSYVMGLVRGDLMPNFDIAVTASPSLKAMDIDQFQTFMQWAQIPDMALQAVTAKILNIPTQYIMELQQARQKAAMAQPPQPGQLPPPALGQTMPPQAMLGLPPPNMGPPPMPPQGMMAA